MMQQSIWDMWCVLVQQYNDVLFIAVPKKDYGE